MKKKCIACHKEVEMPVLSLWINAETMRTCPVCVDQALDRLYLVCALSAEVPKVLSETTVLRMEIRSLRSQLKRRSTGYLFSEQARHNRSEATKLVWKKRKAQPAS